MAAQRLGSPLTVFSGNSYSPIIKFTFIFTHTFADRERGIKGRERERERGERRARERESQRERVRESEGVCVNKRYMAVLL